LYRLFALLSYDTPPIDTYTLSLHDALPIYWWQSHKETGLEETHSEFLNNFNNADFIPAIYNPILHKYYYQNNLKHWDSESMEVRSEEHTSELQSRFDLVCRLLLEKKK